MEKSLGAKMAPTCNISAEASAADGADASANILDCYFSADVETDGPIPGPYSLLSFALVFAGSYDGRRFRAPDDYRSEVFYVELKPISDSFEPEALQVNGLDRNALLHRGAEPSTAMTEAARWVKTIANGRTPVLVAYPLSFDWSWLYWYFIRFSAIGSPFKHSRCFDVKTAYAVKAGVPISEAGRSKLTFSLYPRRTHTHNAVEDAIEQAEIFANLFLWRNVDARNP